MFKALQQTVSTVICEVSKKHSAAQRRALKITEILYMRHMTKTIAVFGSQSAQMGK